MGNPKTLWVWKSMVIDFTNYQDKRSRNSFSFEWKKGEKPYDTDGYKLDYALHYLGTPDMEVHEWYNGGYSSEYNHALFYAKELGFIEFLTKDADNMSDEEYDKIVWPCRDKSYWENKK